MQTPCCVQLAAFHIPRRQPRSLMGGADGPAWLGRGIVGHAYRWSFCLFPAPRCQLHETPGGTLKEEASKKWTTPRDGFHGARRELSQLYLGQQSRHVNTTESTKRRSPFVLRHARAKVGLKECKQSVNPEAEPHVAFSSFASTLSSYSSPFISSTFQLLSSHPRLSPTIQLLLCNICALD